MALYKHQRPRCSLEAHQRHVDVGPPDVEILKTVQFEYKIASNASNIQKVNY